MCLKHYYIAKLEKLDFLDMLIIFYNDKVNKLMFVYSFMIHTTTSSLFVSKSGSMRKTLNARDLSSVCLYFLFVVLLISYFNTYDHILLLLLYGYNLM